MAAVAKECIHILNASQQNQHGEPVLEQWFWSKTMKRYQIALAER